MSVVRLIPSRTWALRNFFHPTLPAVAAGLERELTNSLLPKQRETNKKTAGIFLRYAQQHCLQSHQKDWRIRCARINVEDVRFRING